MLHVVPTPIGNLEDITLRALRVLKEVTVVLAEDTRTSRRLLDHYGITTPLRAFHAFNEHAVVERIVDELASGVEIALISDAGTPGISDPGFLLLRECVRQGIPVSCLPGPTALIPALVQSGLPCDKFWFEGFLPHKKGRQTRLTALAQLSQTIILYESPQRLCKTLGQLAEAMGKDRPAAVVRELSKLHEETARGTLSSLMAHFAEKNVKGEIVIIVGGGNHADPIDTEAEE